MTTALGHHSVARVAGETVFVVAVIAAIGWLDYVTGPQKVFAPFYVIPIAAAAWWLTPFSAWCAVAAAATSRFLAESTWSSLSALPVSVWNTFAHVLIFAVAVVIATRVRTQRARERADVLTAQQADAETLRQERLVAEQALRESEERYRHVFEFLNDAAFLADTETGRILDANLQAAALLGRPRHEIVGMHQTELHPANKVDAYRAHFASHVEKGHLVDYDAEVVRKDGIVVPVMISASTFSLAGRSVILGLFRDLTEYKQLETQFLQAQKMEVIGRLAGGVAHDFNNLLTAIIGYSELLRQRVTDHPDIAADLREIESAAERAAQLTRRLLVFSRRQVWAPRTINLNETVSSFEKMLRRIIGEDVRLTIVRAPSLGQTNVDPGQIELLLLNLVVNARDAMPQGGSLAIATADVVLDEDFAQRHVGTTPGRFVSLAVHDTGCGMTADVLARTGEPFLTTKEPGKGTGLGLATVFSLVKECGGQITIDSTRGVGTTVTMYFPRVDDRVDAAMVEPEPAETLKGTETILLVEDETGVRKLMRKVLKRYGYKVLEAPDARKAMAIEEHHQGAIHLLLSDLIMPGLSGPDLAQRLVRRRPAIKVLFVSGRISREGVKRGLHSRNATFLQKPFRPETLAQAVREHLDRHVGDAGWGSACA